MRLDHIEDESFETDNKTRSALDHKISPENRGNINALSALNYKGTKTRAKQSLKVESREFKDLMKNKSTWMTMNVRKIIKTSR